jgi:hypothetical protein
MCKSALLYIVQRKLERLELIKGNAVSVLLGYSCVVLAVLVSMHVFYKTASLPCHHYESKELAIALSPLWLDTFVSTGMKYLSADAAISPSGMLTQCMLAGFAGALLTRTESFPSSVHCHSMAGVSVADELQGAPVLSVLIAPPGADRPLLPSDRTWLIATAVAAAAALLAHRLWGHRIDRLGHLPAAAVALAAWAATVCRFAAIGGDDAYYAGYAASFIAPVLAQALNPADPDAGHIAPSCHRPSRVAAALAAALAALNSADRLYLAFAWDPAAPQAPQLRAALAAAALKAAASLLVAGCLRARLACAVDLPFAASNARLLDKFRPDPSPGGGDSRSGGGSGEALIVISLEIVALQAMPE